MDPGLANEGDEWLARLYELNAIVAAAGERLEGNLCYDNFDPDFAAKPPMPESYPKRSRLRQAVEGRTRMLEVGVNGGHSAFVALSANPSLSYHGVDIGEHGYVRPAVEWLQREFPGRVTYTEGDSLQVLPRLAREPERYDVFHVDGAKWTYYRDILNAHLMALPGALLIMDDTNRSALADTWARAMRQDLLEASAEFPEQPDEERWRNSVGLMPPVAPRRIRWLHWKLAARNRARRARAALRGG